ncbi:MAG: hypothetical protein K2N31_06480 [Treponemataceae bacterium]|nr:hypothetical protein [Treponemataceae bacterium]
MKKAKKMLLAASALALVSFGLIGCGEEDDDVNEMISGGNNDYLIAYTNDSNLTSRGYVPTTLKHAGAIMEFKFTNSTANSGAGVLGFIWELKDDGAAAKQFYVLGVRQDKGIPSYYVSHFTNVTNINAENFGTKLPTNPAVEDFVSPLNGKGDADGVGFKKIGTSSWADDAGTVTVYADIADVVGGYEIRFYRTKVAAENKSDLDKVGDVIKIRSDCDAAVKPDQAYLAVYANVYGYKTLTGSWKYVKTSRDLEVAEAE